MTGVVGVVGSSRCWEWMMLIGSGSRSLFVWLVS